jgi:hypothetical protein
VGDALPAPWLLAVPVLAIRLCWAGWAVVMALLLYGEGRRALGDLGAYWRRAGWMRERGEAVVAAPREG